MSGAYRARSRSWPAPARSERSARRRRSSSPGKAARGQVDADATPVVDFDDDIRAALDWLEADDRVADVGPRATGHCTGPHLGFRAAFDPLVRAAALWYPTSARWEAGQGTRRGLARVRGGDSPGGYVVVSNDDGSSLPLTGWRSRTTRRPGTRSRLPISGGGVIRTYCSSRIKTHSCLRADASTRYAANSKKVALAACLTRSRSRSGTLAYRFRAWCTQQR